jgi:hypothetical protein
MLGYIWLCQVMLSYIRLLGLGYVRLLKVILGYVRFDEVWFENVRLH